MAQIRLEPNRAYPSIPTVGDTLESHRLALEAIVECIATHERRSKNVLDSFVRVGELQDMGLIELEGTASTGPGSSYIVDDDPSEESTSHHHNGTYLRIDGDNSMENGTGISWIDAATNATDFLALTASAGAVTVEHLYSYIDTSPTLQEVTNDAAYEVLHTALNGSFTDGDTYLLVCEAIYGAASGASADQPTDSSIKITYNGVTMASDETTDRALDSVGHSGEPIGFAKIVTGNSAASVQLQGKSADAPDNSIRSAIMRTFAINLTDLTSSNYIAETVVATSASVAGAEDAYASVGTYAIGDGTSDYVLFCNFKAAMTDSKSGAAPDFEAWLRVNGGPYSNSEIMRVGGSERTHTNDSYSRLFVLGVPAAANATLDFQCAWHSFAGYVIPTDGSIAVTISVIALRLNDFTDYFLTNSADLTDPGSSGVKERLNTPSMVNDAASGNWHFFGGLSSYFPGSGNGPENAVSLELDGGGDVYVAGDINDLSHDCTSSNQMSWLGAFPASATNVNNGQAMEAGLWMDTAPNAASETWQVGVLMGWSHVATPTIEKFYVGDEAGGSQTWIDGSLTTVNSPLTVVGAATMQSTLNVQGATDLDSTLNVDGIADFQTDARVFGNLGVGPGITSPAHVLHLRDDTTDTAANEIANFEWLRPSAANNDNLNVLFSLANSVGTGVEVGRIKYQIQDITAGAEDGAIIFDVIRAGVLEQVVVMDTDEIIFNDAGADRNFIVKQSGGGTAMQVTGSTGVADFNNNVDINGGTLTIYDATPAESLALYHNGTDAYYDVSTGQHWFHTAGTDRIAINSSGIEGTEQTYSPRMTSKSGSSTNPCAFTPRKDDPNTGIYSRSFDDLGLVAGQAVAAGYDETNFQVTISHQSLYGQVADVSQVQGNSIKYSSYTQIDTVANENDSITLTNAYRGPGTYQYVLNHGANRLQVFPYSGDYINDGAVNESDTIGAGMGKLYIVASTEERWREFKPEIGLDQLSVDFHDFLDFAVGMTLDDIDESESSDGVTVTFSIQKEGGGDIRFFFTDGIHTHDCTPADTVSLTPGTDTSPQINYIYILQSTKALTASTSGWPATEYAPLATALVQSAASVQTDGLYKFHKWTDHAWDGTTGHIEHLNYWIRNQSAQWVSGGLCTPTVGAATFDLSVASATILQLHDHSYPAFNTATGSELMIPNQQATPYDRVGNLVNQLTDASGGSMSNKYYNLVVWGVVSEDDADCQLMVNVPTGSYNTSAAAILDADAYTVYDIPSDFKGTGFLIARLTVRHQSGSNTYTIEQNTDLRGKLPSVSAGGTTGGGVTAFSDLSDGDLTGVATGDLVYYDGASLVDTGGKLTWAPGTGAFTVYDSTGADTAVVRHSGTYAYFEATNASRVYLKGGDILLQNAAGTEQFKINWGGTNQLWENSLAHTSVQWEDGDGTLYYTFNFAGTNTSGFTISRGNRLELRGTTGTNNAGIYHDNTDLNISKNSGTVDNVNIRDGMGLRIYDGTDTDSARFYHDGTDLYTDFTNTTWWRITNVGAGVIFDDGVAVYIRDSTGTDSIAMSHDGTDFNTTFTTTTNWEIRGLSSEIQIEGIDVALEAGSDLWIYDATNTDAARFYHDGTNFNQEFYTTGKVIWYDGATAAVAVDLTGNVFELNAGYGLVIRDGTDADYGLFSHNGTDFSTSFSGTTDWNIEGLTGEVWIRDGAGLRILDSSDTDSATFSHDGTDFNIDGTNTVAMNWTGFDAFEWTESVTGNMHLQILNSSATDGDRVRLTLSCQAGANNLAIFAQGSTTTTSAVTGGPTGGAGFIRTFGDTPLSIGTNNNERLRVQGDGEMIAKSLFHAQANFGYKTATTARTSTTTLTDDPDLTVSILQSGFYRFEAFIRVTSDNNTPDFKWDWNYTGTLTQSAYRWSSVSTAAGETVDAESNVTTDQTLETNTVERMVSMIGYIDVANAGTFSFRWSQNVSDASNSTDVLLGSWIRIERMGDT